MSNKTRNKGKIPASLMLRVDACAMIFLADRPEKIKSIALSNGCDELTAGRIYTIGALNAVQRRGIARNYDEAITRLENEQMGDRGDPILKTISAEKTASDIARINRINNSGTTAIYRQGYRVDPEGNAEQTRFYMGNMESKTVEKTERAHTVNTDKAFGSYYTEWEERVVESDPGRIYDTTGETVARNMVLYFTEYTQRMSNTVRKRIAELQRYTGDIKALVSAKGRTDPDTSRLANFVVNLHRHFDHKDALTVSEFAGLLKQYTPKMEIDMSK